jgi:2-polyprenyl-3-methyl-5-hydroxy-6-metoxy-1,4-benzoquinol methylase
MHEVRLQLFRDNLQGALQMVEHAYSAFADPRYKSEADRIRSWLRHLETRDAYAAAYERYYRRVKRRFGFKLLEREFRTLIGRKTRKMVARCSGLREFQLVEQEVAAHGARHVLDAGCGEGRMALTLGARHPDIVVEGLEVSPTNAHIARRLNRFSNVTFHAGLIEEADHFFRPASFDLVYSLAVLEHVRDVDEIVTAVLKLLKPGGRFCLSVPMNEFRATGPLPDFTPQDTACHVRVFTEAGLRNRFGGYRDFTFLKIPGEWRRGRYPDPLVPVEFGAYFVAISKR